MRARLADDQRVCIIGAGAAGLATAWALTEAGVPFDCYERSSTVGGMWAREGSTPTYRSLHLNSSASMVQFPSLPMPSRCDFPERREVAEYLAGFADHFALRGDIRLRCGVRDVTRIDTGWRVTLDDLTAREYVGVVVCTGHLQRPMMPPLPPGRFDGAILHSHDYWSTAPFDGGRVVVVGFGNTAVDIASELAHVTDRTVLSVRRGVHVIPKLLLGVPFDRFPAPSRPRRLRWEWLSLIARIESGDLSDYGLPRPTYRLGCGPVAISSDFISRMRHGKLRIAPPISEFDGDAVRFADGTRLAADAVIYCTGYELDMPFLDASLVPLRDDGPPALFQRTFATQTPGLRFVGMVQPLGAFMPIFEHQARLVAEEFAGSYRLPAAEQILAATARDRRRWDRRFAGAPRARLQVDGTEFARALRTELARGQRRARRTGAARAAAGAVA